MKRALLCAAALAFSSFASADDGKELFNGKDLTGWKGNPEVWSVKDGAITGTTTNEKPLTYNTFLVWQDGKPANFELRAKYKMVGNNSGIQYRSQVIDEEKFIVGGYQADIDASLQFSGINYEERGRGILAERGQSVTINADKSKTVVQFADAKELGKLIKNEDWNDYLVIARGNHLQHFINGVLMSEVIDEESDKAAKDGVIALQAHVGPAMVIQFKDLVLKETK
jgi:hypothetical protein